MPTPYKTQSVVVANGETSSSEVDLSDLLLCGVYIPAVVEGTTLTFTVSNATGGTFLPMWTAASGAVVAYTIDATGCYVALDPSLFAGVRYVKAVLGSQTGDVTLTLTLRPA